MKIQFLKCCNIMNELFADGVVRILPAKDKDKTSIIMTAKNEKILMIKYCPFCGEKIEIK